MDRILGIGLIQFIMLWIAFSLMTILMKGVLNAKPVDGLTEIVNTI